MGISASRRTFWPGRHRGSYLFEELYRQGVLSSDFFLNEKRFLHGIEGKPDPERMKSFQDALERARKLAKARLAKDKKDPEAIFAFTLAAGMESNSDMMLKKKHIESLKRLKEGNEYAKELLAEQPDANDAYVALGSANYIIGSLSGGTRFFLMFGGIHGDKKLGMQQLGKQLMEDGICSRLRRSCWHWRRAEKNKTRGAEAAPRIEPGISGKPPLRRRVCESDGSADSCKDASLSPFACFCATAGLFRINQRRSPG